MATKQEYIDTLVCITKEYYSTVRSAEEANKFNCYLRLFEGLVDEHFGEKKETNFEHFKNEIKDKQFDFAVIDGKVLQCKGCLCDECLFNSTKTCDIAKTERLLQKHVKPAYKLNQFEYDLLQSYSQSYSPKYQFKNINSLIEMRGKGYFKDIDLDLTIDEILGNCEVIK